MKNEHFQQNLIRWVESRADVQAVLLVGSLARDDHPADSWSDVDLILFVEDVEVFAHEESWLAALGEALLPVFERHESGDGEWLALFADGQKVDFYFTMGAGDLTAVLPSAAYFPVIQRGAKLWYQRPGVDLHLPDPQPAPAARPAEAEFLALVGAMFLYGHKMAKLMRRGDVVRAKMVLESVLRPPLLTLIAWHAQAMFGPDRDTWYNGRFLAEWADPRVLPALPNTYGGYSTEETWRSLFGVLILSRWLAEETAVHWHFSFPEAAAEQVTAWIRELYLTKDNDLHII